MRNIVFIILFFIATSDYTVAQTNLVPNGSFEVYSSCPTGAAQIIKAVPWDSPTISTPDYFNACNLTGMGVPSNSIGYQNAVTGVAYTGIATYVDVNPDFRDYIQAPLLDTLTIDRKYYVSFYVSPVDNYYYSTNTIGLLLTNTAVSSGTSQVLPFTPQVENSITNNLTDTTLWYLISDTIIASGGEKYITIGNFQTFANSGIDTANYSAPYGAAYYYIDNVSITDITVGINEDDVLSNIFNIYPNPSTSEINISIRGEDLTNYEISIINILGELQKAKINQSAISVSEFSSGVYFISATSKDGKKRLTQKFIKE